MEPFKQERRRVRTRRAMRPYGRPAHKESSGGTAVLTRPRRPRWWGGLVVAAVLLTAVFLLLLLPRLRAGSAVAPEDDGVLIVALDAGHGGEDNGAVGYCVEQEVTRQTVAWLQDFLEQDGRVTVVLTHPLDEGAQISERARAANEARADLLVSVHCNSGGDPAANGFECYVPLPGRDNYSQSVLLAQAVLEQVQTYLPIHIRGNSGIRHIYFGADDARHVLEYSPTAGDTPSWQRSFGLLEQSRSPAILIEQLFVTNQQDVDSYASEGGTRALAQCYYRAILSYFELELPELM